MEKNKIVDTLKYIIIDTLELDICKDEMNAIESLQINSIDTLEILVRIENEFNIMFEDSELNSDILTNLENLAEVIINHTEKEVCK